MDTATAAQQAGVTVDTIRHWCRIGAVAARKTAGRWIIQAESLAYRISLGVRRRPRKPVYTLDNMLAIGGNRWQRGDFDRVYLNGWERFIGLEITCYKTGNIRYAFLGDERISNGEAGRILGAVRKVYFDVPTCEVRIQWGYSEPRTMSRDDLAEAIFSGIRAEIAELDHGSEGDA